MQPPILFEVHFRPGQVRYRSRLQQDDGAGEVMKLSDVKQFCQGHLFDGLVTVVGSGLSVAEGISGMSKRILPAGFVMQFTEGRI